MVKIGKRPDLILLLFAALMMLPGYVSAGSGIEKKEFAEPNRDADDNMTINLLSRVVEDTHHIMTIGISPPLRHTLARLCKASQNREE